MSRRFLEHFKGPNKDIEGVRSILKVYNGPIVGTALKLKGGYMVEEMEKLTYELELLASGLDYVKDDEDLTSPSFCRFEVWAKAIKR
ncbi:RuBisCO large subunit C-terminal-like domain-containing protein [Thermofilum sp.]|uniref:RuBisCO large subunit C-terminal-like domain-containing protein n=1 Tax=Thermofilum sp. TaxID=1961369 RepID=UPI003165633D